MKIKKLSTKLFLSLFILAFISQTNAQYTLVYQNGEPHYGTFQHVAVDGSGNSFYTGTFGDSLQLGSIKVYKSGPGLQHYVARMDASANWVWVKTIPVTLGLSINNVAADNSGNAYITGTFQGYAIFGGTTINSGANRNSLFVAKMNSSGDFLWVVSQVPKLHYSDASGRSVTTDGNGNVYVTGNITVKTGTAAGAPTIDAIYWAKYNSSGAKQWENTLSPSSGSYPSSYSAILNRGLEIAVDGTGNIYVTGNFHGLVKFANGAGNTISSSHQGAFTTKLNSSGAVQWVRAATPSTPNGGSNPSASSSGLYIDAVGNVNVGGQYSGSNLVFPGFASTLLNPSSVGYGFLAKYSPAGTLSWAVNTADSAKTMSVFKQPSGNSGLLIARKGGMVIAEYSSSGSLESSTASTGGGVTSSFPAAMDAVGISSGYILCGSFKGTSDIGNLSLAAACSYPSGGGCDHNDLVIIQYTGGAAKRPAPALFQPAISKNFSISSYPSPMAQATKIQYTIPTAANVSIMIYDVAGREVGQLFKGERAAGSYILNYNTSALGNGVYNCRITATTGGKEFVQTHKMVKVQ